jgi:hypothetical protein
MDSKTKNALAQLEWYDWREKVIVHITNLIKAQRVWKLLNAEFKSADKISTHQLVLVQRKAQAVLQFMRMMNERAVGDESESGTTMKASEIAEQVGKYTGCSAKSVYNYYLEYKVQVQRTLCVKHVCNHA